MLIRKCKCGKKTSYGDNDTAPCDGCVHCGTRAVDGHPEAEPHAPVDKGDHNECRRCGQYLKEENDVET